MPRPMSLTSDASRLPQFPHLKMDFTLKPDLLRVPYYVSVQMLNDVRQTGQGWGFLSLPYTLRPRLGLWTRVPANPHRASRPVPCLPFPRTFLAWLLSSALHEIQGPFSSNSWPLHLLLFFPKGKNVPLISSFRSLSFDLQIKYNFSGKTFLTSQAGGRSHRHLPGLLHFNNVFLSSLDTEPQCVKTRRPRVVSRKKTNGCCG